MNESNANQSSSVVKTSTILVPKIIYDNKKNKKNINKTNKPSIQPTGTFLSGGGVILNPASYALEQ
jgi:hypothetical protein